MLLIALSLLLSLTAVTVEKFTNDTIGPDECRNGLYRCVYRTIPLGF